VKLTPVGRVQTFLLDAPSGTVPNPGEQVVVQTEHGAAIGTVARAYSGLTERRRPPADSPNRVVRLATREDIVTRLKQRHREQEAYRIALLRIRERGLAMRLTRVEHAFDGSRLVFYFTAEGRVDFRELVRDLAGRFRGRVELRQVGLREEAKQVGGIGSCGRELCCTTFLPAFAPVSIRMAKTQGLALNPSRVTGQCGRLKCCLVYEEAQYVEARRSLPKPGKAVETPDGPGRVADLDVLAGRIRVAFPDKPPATYAAADLRPQGAPAAEGADPPSDPGPDAGGPDDLPNN
jgi:cell fate regulator YaaT (PSP1 superfamily)